MFFFFFFFFFFLSTSLPDIPIESIGLTEKKFKYIFKLATLVAELNFRFPTNLSIFDLQVT